MESDRLKWNQRFNSTETFLGARPSPFLSREMERIKRLSPGMRALDIACGEGRNSIFLAENGFRVTGLDISDVGIAKAKKRAAALGLAIDFHQVDLEGYQLGGCFDLVLNFNFLLRDLIPQEVTALNPGGLLLFDTILASPRLLTEHNPAYLLQQGELVRIFGAYDGEILWSEESSEGDMPTARLIFRKEP